MYNTSGSDIDMEEFEYHSGSRKVRKKPIEIIYFKFNILII
jgi:hypothetical protein